MNHEKFSQTIGNLDKFLNSQYFQNDLGFADKLLRRQNLSSFILILTASRTLFSQKYSPMSSTIKFVSDAGFRENMLKAAEREIFPEIKLAVEYWRFVFSSFTWDQIFEKSRLLEMDVRDFVYF